MAASATVVQLPTAKKKYTTEQAWTPALAKGKGADRGHVAVVRTFLRHYSSLKPYPLTVGEAMFVVHLMDYKWGAEAPWPSYKTLATAMGVSEKMARRHAKSLEDKRLLKRKFRKAQTNLFDLRPLFRALEVKIFGQIESPGL